MRLKFKENQGLLKDNRVCLEKEINKFRINRYKIIWLLLNKIIVKFIYNKKQEIVVIRKKIIMKSGIVWFKMAI
jgi:hypothetical protein